jgi:protein gp37
MNKQGKLVMVDGLQKVAGGIEWCKTIHPDGHESRGYTWNVPGGCKHRCRWEMPDGTVAICYAEAVAEGVARAAYPEGFEHHYWHPERLEEPLKVTQPSRIFLDSMSDLFGHWVPAGQVEQVLDVCREASWHTFLSLTKNPIRMERFDFPANFWPGASSPPDWMHGGRLGRHHQERLLHKALAVLSELPDDLVTWMSFEPLSWDVSGIVEQYPDALRWAVIGAASSGRTYYQPEPGHVERLLAVLDGWEVPVFFKGNLEWSPWREEYPAGETRE